MAASELQRLALTLESANQQELGQQALALASQLRRAILANGTRDTAHGRVISYEVSRRDSKLVEGRGTSIANYVESATT